MRVGPLEKDTADGYFVLDHKLYVFKDRLEPKCP